jgi:hypothetical protein
VSSDVRYDVQPGKYGSYVLDVALKPCPDCVVPTGDPVPNVFEARGTFHATCLKSVDGVGQSSAKGTVEIDAEF